MGQKRDATMTEEEWLNCTDTQTMLEFLRGKSSDRKLRLFAVACVRPHVLRIDDARLAQIVQISESYADLQASWNELVHARKMARGLVEEAMQRRGHIGFGSGFVKWVEAAAHPTASVAAQTTAELGKAVLLREIIGPVLFRPVAFDRTWLAWNDATIPKLAQAIYDDRTFDRLPVLADALAEANTVFMNCRSASTIF
jgi:hypothetical protein